MPPSVRKCLVLLLSIHTHSTSTAPPPNAISALCTVSYQQNLTFYQRQDILLDLSSLYLRVCIVCPVTLWIPGCHCPSVVYSQSWHPACLQTAAWLKLIPGNHQLPASRTSSRSTLISNQPHFLLGFVWIWEADAEVWNYMILAVVHCNAIYIVITNSILLNVTLGNLRNMFNAHCLIYFHNLGK